VCGGDKRITCLLYKPPPVDKQAAAAALATETATAAVVLLLVVAAGAVTEAGTGAAGPAAGAAAAAEVADAEAQAPSEAVAIAARQGALSAAESDYSEGGQGQLLAVAEAVAVAEREGSTESGSSEGEGDSLPPSPRHQRLRGRSASLPIRQQNPHSGKPGKPYAPARFPLPSTREEGRIPLGARRATVPADANTQPRMIADRGRRREHALTRREPALNFGPGSFSECPVSAGPERSGDWGARGGTGGHHSRSLSPRRDGRAMDCWQIEMGEMD